MNQLSCRLESWFGETDIKHCDACLNMNENLFGRAVYSTRKHILYTSRRDKNRIYSCHTNKSRSSTTASIPFAMRKRAIFEEEQRGSYNPASDFRHYNRMNKVKWNFYRWMVSQVGKKRYQAAMCPLFHSNIRLLCEWVSGEQGKWVCYVK